MKRYESMILLKINIKNRNKILDRIKEIINKEGEITLLEDKGINELAYEIKGNTKADYILLHYLCSNNVNKNLEDFYRNTPNVIKYLIIKGEE